MTMNDTFLKDCRREQVDYTPIWLMRQAGRYMEEYRVIRQKYDFLTMCKTPELAVEVTLQPVNKVGVDAAILFADILLPLEGMGIGFGFAKNEGPVIHNPVRRLSDVEKIKIIEPEEDVPYVLEAIKILRRELVDRIPLIGFSGAPFTLASYIIEGGHSRNYVYAKTMMYKEPETWHLLMDKVADVVIRYLNAQIDAGAQVVQLFDSWVGVLSPQDYEAYVLPHSKKVIDNLKKGVPVIHFGTNTNTFLEMIKKAGGDVIGVDWRIDIGDAWDRLGDDVAVQGNLDPTVLLGPRKEIEKRAKEILDTVGNRPGHIFNLGHGLIPEIPVENVQALVQIVHEYSKR
jgi:uroporphyrinogen decarboxylase